MNGNGFGRNGARRRRRRSLSGWQTLVKLSKPGIGVKRWTLLGAAGVGMCSVGLAYLMFRQFGFNLPDFIEGNLDVVIMASAFLVFGVGSVIAAAYGFHRSFGAELLESTEIAGIVDEVYTRRRRARGPRIVAIGGGTGLSVLLRGLKEYTDNLTAIVTVGDDGGSSGRLRSELGILPPGDLRNCIVAMADDESLVAELFQYRFDRGEGLKGHSFGNLFIAAMTNVTGSFDEALVESSRVLSVHGKVVPSTMANLRISAQASNGAVIHGESNVGAVNGSLERVSIHPSDAAAHPLALNALREAQIIVIGPGSLYTSILPNLLVDGVSDAVRASHATKVYVANIATEQGETEGYSVHDHYAALTEHTSSGIVGHVIANINPRDLGPEFFGAPVAHDGRLPKRARLHLQDLADAEHPVRHDSEKLAQTIMDVYDKFGGWR